MAGEVPSANLSDLYRIAVEEYRFQVKLGWDRTKFYLTLNSALLSAGAALFRTSGPDRWLSGSVFLVGMATSALGVRAIATGHRYYRRTVVQKTKIEDTLGLLAPVGSAFGPASTLTVSTTAGQSKPFEILNDPDEYIRRGLRPGTINHLLSTVLWFVAALHTFGAGLVLGPPLLAWFEAL